MKYDVGGAAGGIASIGIVHRRDADSAWNDWIASMGLADKDEDQTGGGGGGSKGGQGGGGKKAGGGGRGGTDSEPHTWAAFLKERALCLLAGRPNVATSGKNLVHFATLIGNPSNQLTA